MMEENECRCERTVWAVLDEMGVEYERAESEVC